MRITKDTLELIYSSMMTEERAKAFASIVWEILSQADTYENAKLIATIKFTRSGNPAESAMLPYVLDAINVIQQSGFTLK